MGQTSARMNATWPVLRFQIRTPIHPTTKGIANSVTQRKRDNMKKVTLILPDKILYTIGTSTSSEVRELETDHKNMTEALECNDYHISYYYPNGSVEVVAVENV